MTAGYREFEFDLPGALLLHMITVLDDLEAAPLDPAFLYDIPEVQGIYQLYLDGELVYVGKTDADSGLSSRLRRHERAIRHRVGLDPGRVSFKALRVYVFTAIDLETQLISHYGGYDVVRWNGSGFGANDPGRQRDTTTYRPDHFDVVFPIDIDRPLEITFPHTATAAEVLNAVKNTVPYVFRFEAAGGRSRQPHPDLLTTVTIPDDMMLTARGVLMTVVPELPKGWQATQLPGRVILYKETRSYAQGAIIAKS